MKTQDRCTVTCVPTTHATVSFLLPDTAEVAGKPPLESNMLVGTSVPQVAKGVCWLQELKKGRVRRLWEWGRMLYRITAFSYGAFSVYENPWLVRAVLAALWTACRMLVGAGVKSIL